MQGDCLELMKDIPDSSVDMVLCDLPYGTTANAWDNIIPFEPLWEQYRRITKPNAAIVLFSQMPFTAKLVMSNIKEFRYEWIWKKPNGTGFLNVNKMPLKAHENICIFYSALPTYKPQFRKGDLHIRGNVGGLSDNYGKFTRTKGEFTDEYYPDDILQFDSQPHSKEGHPTQKPVPLLEYLINTYTNEGDMVLDNCMGSGSTGIACINTQRNFIGIELDENYFKIASDRIGKAQHQVTLYDL